MNQDKKEELGTTTGPLATNLRLVSPEPSQNTPIMPQLDEDSQPVLASLYTGQLEEIDEICAYIGLTRSEAIRMLVALGLEALELGVVIDEAPIGRLELVNDGENR